MGQDNSGPLQKGHEYEQQAEALLPEREFALRLQSLRVQVAELLQTAPSPALEMILWHIQENLFVAQEYAAPETLLELTPYDQLLGFSTL